MPALLTDVFGQIETLRLDGEPEAVEMSRTSFLQLCRELCEWQGREFDDLSQVAAEIEWEMLVSPPDDLSVEWRLAGVSVRPVEAEGPFVLVTR